MKQILIYLLTYIAINGYYDYEEEISVRQSLGALHWNYASSVFPRYSTAKIIDVVTQKTFYVKRTFGRNHADVEPLTKEDTYIIRTLWGGSDSWERRAVIVVIDGYKIAASMNGYAHAGLDRYPVLATVNNRSGGFGRGINLDMVKGNGVDGHFCLHFYGSRTHGSGRVNSQHQDQISIARTFLEQN